MFRHVTLLFAKFARHEPRLVAMYNSLQLALYFHGF